MRYTGEVRFRLIGSRGEAVKYLSQGRTILGDVFERDGDLGGLTLGKRKFTLPNGVRITAWMNDVLPIVEIDVTPLEPPDLEQQRYYEMRLAWVPEGIVMTPVNEDHPDGWGLPMRTAAQTGNEPNIIPAGTILTPPYDGVPIEEYVEEFDPATILTTPFGTDGGILPQVILNRFPNNKYLDLPTGLTGLPAEVVGTMTPDNPRLRENFNTPSILPDNTSYHVSWQMLYNLLDCPPVDPEEDDGGQYWADPANHVFFGQIPGAYLVTEFSSETSNISFTFPLEYPQFADNFFTEIITEAESDQWYCHRPYEMLYERDAYEGVFQQTNVIRAEVNRGPMYRQLRGHSNIARMSAQEVVISGKQFHDSEDFRPGYERMWARAHAGMGRSQNNENLIIDGGVPIEFSYAYDYGVFLADAWKDSPPHYANQISTIWDDPDYPGAEHFVASELGTVDESQYAGELPEPLSGLETCQSFAKMEYWLPVTGAFHEGQWGVTGRYGTENEWARNYLFVGFYVTYKGHTIYLAGYENDDTFAGIHGCAPYGAVRVIGEESEGNTEDYMRLRAVVVQLSNRNSSIGYMRYTVLTKPIQRANEYYCEWDTEASITFEIADGYLPYPQGDVKFNSDGTKFVFSVGKKGASYSQALDFRAHDFNTDRSDLYRPRSAIELVFVEYDSTNPDVQNRWTETTVASPKVSVRAETTNSGGVNHTNVYERSLKADVPIFVDYDENDQLAFVHAVVDEYSLQSWTWNLGSGDPITTNFGWRTRKLVFPSGKELTYLQSYMEDAETITDMVDVATRGWPGSRDGNYTREILHLDVVREDVVYRQLGWDAEVVYIDDIQAYVDYYGKHSIVADLSYDFQPEGKVRNVQVMYESVGEEYWGYYQIFVPDFLIKSSNNPPDPRYFYDTKVSLEYSSGIYNYDTTPISRWTTLYGQQWVFIRSCVPSPYMWAPSNDAEGSLDNFDDAIFGRHAFDDYFASVAPGFSRTVRGGQDNTYPFYPPDVWDSFGVCNIAPQIAEQIDAICRVVHYKDRTVVYVRTDRVPFAWPPGPGFILDFADVEAAYEDVPEEYKVVMYTNFDLDEAVGMTNVTDIYPLGKI